MTSILNSITALIPFILLFVHSEKAEGYFDPAERACANRYRGFFALLVILHHMAQRVTAKGLLWIYYDTGFLAVAMFFFYSGYGLMKKGIAQKKGFFRKRLPGVLMPYIETMFLYWILYALTGDVKSPGSLLLEHFHNESGISFLWYVFSYLAWILFLGISLHFCREDRHILYAACLFAALYIAVCLVTVPQFFWIYNTVLLIPCGCAWAYYETDILAWIRKHYAAVLSLSLLVFGVSFIGHADIILRVPAYMLSAVSFMIFLNTVTMKRRPGSMALSFLGTISYEIYVLHGIPVTFLRDVIPSEALWTLSVPVIAVISAYLLHEAGKRLWKKQRS
ncbi:MAG: acyltransferase family protein [Solobacterium sp.]|nr:acyltransferase family protein [Solobacterium sp.]